MSISDFNQKCFLFLEMIQPPFLKPGNTIGIVAPARKLDKTTVVHAITILENWGLNVVLANNLFADDHSYFSSTDENRANDFQQMIDDASVHAILCTRGGYGSTRIIDQLDFSTLHHNAKWIIGFSDITAIHLHLHKLGLQSIHAIMPVLFSNENAKESVESLRQLLFGDPQPIQAIPDDRNRGGDAEGLLLGGNLSLIVDSLGTQSGPDTNGKILVVEEVDEYFYKVDRMFMQLKRAGKLEKLSGLVVGHFTDIKETSLTFGDSVKEIVCSHTKEYKYPIAFNFPIGHDKPNLAWIEGAKINLMVSDSGGKISYTKEKTNP